MLLMLTPPSSFSAANGLGGIRIENELTEVSHEGTERITQETVSEGSGLIMNDKAIAQELYRDNHTFQCYQMEGGSHSVGHDERIKWHVCKYIKHHRSCEYMPPAFLHAEQQQALKDDGTHQWHEQILAGGIVLGKLPNMKPGNSAIASSPKAIPSRPDKALVARKSVQGMERLMRNRVVGTNPSCHGHIRNTVPLNRSEAIKTLRTPNHLERYPPIILPTMTTMLIKTIIMGALIDGIPVRSIGTLSPRNARPDTTIIRQER